MKIWFLESRYFCLNDLDVGLSMLSAEEEHRHSRYSQAAHRHHFVMGRSLVRYALGQLTLSDPSVWQLKTLNSGQLIAEGPERVFLSLSRSLDSAACILSVEGPVGIDIACQEQNKWNTDLRDWTRFEASLKIEGRGLGQVDDCKANPVLATEEALGFTTVHSILHLSKVYHLCASFLENTIETTTIPVELVRGPLFENVGQRENLQISLAPSHDVCCIRSECG